MTLHQSKALRLTSILFYCCLAFYQSWDAIEDFLEDASAQDKIASQINLQLIPQTPLENDADANIPTVLDRALVSRTQEWGIKTASTLNLVDQQTLPLSLTHSPDVNGLSPPRRHTLELPRNLGRSELLALFSLYSLAPPAV